MRRFDAKDWLRRAFLDNAALKIVALLLSLTLFIVVRGDRDTTISFYLPVAYTETPGRVMTSKPVDSVRVTVSGPWTRLRRFDDRQVEPIRVDLGKLTDGEFIFAGDLVQLPPGLRVTAINPPSIRLSFEERAEKTVAVRAQLDGQLARGYLLDRMVVTPSHVTIRGPKSVLEAMSEVRTRPIDIDGRSQSGEARVPLEPTEAHLTVVDNPTIEVRYSVTEEQGERSIPSLRVDLRPAPGSRLAPPTDATLEPGKVRLTLRGSRLLLDRIDPSDVTAYVTWYAEDQKAAAPRPARVIVEGVPPGVAIDIDPRDVTLKPRR